jgi:hypothetical protein
LNLLRDCAISNEFVPRTDAAPGTEARNEAIPKLLL